jgi:hypothetical protein
VVAAVDAFRVKRINVLTLGFRGVGERSDWVILGVASWKSGGNLLNHLE